MCRQLGVTEQGYYQWRKRPPCATILRNQMLMAEIDIIYHQARDQRPGRRMVHKALIAQGIYTNIKHVGRLMQSMDLVGRHTKKYKVTTVQSADACAIPDLIKRDFSAVDINQKWCGDITAIQTAQGWVYTATVIDLASRNPIGIAHATNMRTDLIVEALSKALKARNYPTDVIFHSDRGSQYTSHQFGLFCKKHTVRQSMGRTGVCWDNAVAESFFATYKKELIHTRPWKNLAHVARETFQYVETYYKKIRRHSYLGYLTPEEYELGYRDINELAA